MSKKYRYSAIETTLNNILSNAKPSWFNINKNKAETTGASKIWRLSYYSSTSTLFQADVDRAEEKGVMHDEFLFTFKHLLDESIFDEELNHLFRSGPLAFKTKMPVLEKIKGGYKYYYNRNRLKQIDSDRFIYVIDDEGNDFDVFKTLPIPKEIYKALFGVTDKDEREDSKKMQWTAKPIDLPQHLIVSEYSTFSNVKVKDTDSVVFCAGYIRDTEIEGGLFLDEDSSIIQLHSSPGVGRNVVIEAETTIKGKIGNNVRVGNNVLCDWGSSIGNNCKLDDNTYINQYQEIPPYQTIQVKLPLILAGLTGYDGLDIDSLFRFADVRRRTLEKDYFF